MHHEDMWSCQVLNVSWRHVKLLSVGCIMKTCEVVGCGSVGACSQSSHLTWLLTTWSNCRLTLHPSSALNSWWPRSRTFNLGLKDFSRHWQNDLICVEWDVKPLIPCRVDVKPQLTRSIRDTDTCLPSCHVSWCDICHCLTCVFIDSDLLWNESCAITVK